MYSGVGKYDEEVLRFVDNETIQICVFDETDFGGMSKERWFYNRHNTEVLSYVQYWLLRQIFNDKGIVYFMRKMDKTIKFPQWVYPYEKCIMNDLPLANPDELFSRPVEISFLGNVSPQRISVCNELQRHFMCDFRLGQEKLPNDEWLQRHRNSKLFLTADGGGFSDERSQQLITISPMLRQKNNHLQANPFSDCVNCIEISEHPTQEEVSNIKSIISDKEYLYEIYEEGVAHMKTYYTKEARSLYILDILKQNGII